MSRHQVRLLLCSLASVALIVSALLFVDWFRIDFGAAQVSIGLRRARMCIPDEGCRTMGLGAMHGFYPIIAGAAFWSAAVLQLIVLAQCAVKLFNGASSPLAGKAAYVLGSTAFLSAFGAGYLFAPEADGLFQVMGATVTGTIAPPLLLAGTLLGMLSVRYAVYDDVDDATGEYKPIVIDKGGAVSSPGRSATPTAQRERIVTPTGAPSAGPGPRERVPTPGSFERIPLPGHRDRVTTPGPRERVPTPGSFERIPLPGQRDRVATPGPRERVPTPGSFERIPLPGHRDRVATPPGQSERIPSPLARERVPAVYEIADEAEDEAEIELVPAGRTPTPMEQPLVARTTSPGDRTRTSSEQPLVARTNSPGGRARTSSEQPLPGSGTSVAARGASTKEPPLVAASSAEQPLVARTTSPGDRVRAPSEQPLARTTSPGGRARTSSEQPLAGSGTSVAARGAASEQPLVARTTSPGGRARSGSEQPLAGSGTSVTAAGRSAQPDPRAKAPSQPGERAKAPSQPGERAKAPSQPGERSKAPSQPGERAKAPSQPLDDVGLPLDLAARAHTSSSGPIDLAARLHAAPIAVAIKPPLPEPIPVPPDQIPVAPESGLVIRKRTGSAGPLSAHQLPAPLPPTTPVMPGPVVIQPRSRSASRPPATAPDAMPSIALRAIGDDIGDLATRNATPPLAVPIVAVDPSVKLERRSTTPPLAIPVVELDDDEYAEFEAKSVTPPFELPIVDVDPNVELEKMSATPPLALPVVDANVSLSFEPTPPPVSPAAVSPLRPRVVERTPSVGVVFASPSRARASEPPPVGRAPASHPLHGKLRYAVATAKLSSIGIDADREDGTHVQVVWEAIIGIIARRLPLELPHDGSTFVDLVSNTGATLRILPWTRIDGAPLFGEGEERARAFVQLVAMRCLDAKLDTWTKVFADGAGHAAQLPSAKTLAAHDERLA